MTKKEIIIKTELQLPDITLEEIKTNIENKDKTLIADEVIKILEVEKIMTEEKKKFQELVNKELESYNEKYKQLSDYINKDLKPSILDYIDKAGFKDEYVNQSTGEIISKMKHNLQKGFSYRAGSTTFKFDEDKLEDKWFKKTLKKADATKAAKAGEIPVENYEIVKGNPSITLNLENMKLGLEKEKEVKDEK